MRTKLHSASDSRPRQRRRKLLLWSAGLLVFYTVFGFLILPWIVKAVAQKQIATQLDRETIIRQVRINPYTLSATVRGLLVKDKDGQPFVSVEEAYANFQLSSFFGKAWVFKDIWTIKPYCRVQINKDYSLNFSDLAEKFSKPADKPKPTAPSKPVLLHIGHLQIKGATTSFTDLTPRVPFHRLIGPVEIIITELHTDPDKKNPYSFAGTTEAGEKFTWNGDFSLEPLRSEGEFSLENLSIPKYGTLFEDLFRFEIRDGTIGGHATYSAGASGANYVASITNATFSLVNLKIGEKEKTNNLAELDKLVISSLSADTSRRAGEIGEVTVAGGRILAERDREQKINLVQMAQPAQDTTNTPGGIVFLMQAFTNAYTALLQTTNLWTATLHSLQVTNCLVGWKDEAASSPVSLSVDNLAVNAKELSNVPGPKQTAEVSFHWNTNGVVRVGSTLQLSPLAADASLVFQNVELNSINPYLQGIVNVFLLGSKVNLDAKLNMQTGSNGLPQVTFHGGGSLDDFAAVDLQQEDLVRFRSVQFHGIEATLQPPNVAVRALDIIEPAIRVAFDTNQSLNFLSVMKVDTNAPVAMTLDTNAAASAANTANLSMGQRLGAMLEKALSANTNSTGKPAARTFSIGTVAISNGIVQFNDRSIQPPVKASLEKINGTIKGVSSDALKRADIALSASAARTGPIEIKGKINPLSQAAATELQVTFHDVDLTPGSPYSGKYLGYRLNRGKLGLQVDYRVEKRQLRATNIVTVDHLTLGEKVRSPDATKLPVKLALAILKDRNGRIELDVPIEGNLDDPTFHFGKVIVHVLGNIVSKLATAPFAALGSLFGGKGEEVSYQDFKPGETEPDPAHKGKLDAFANGLYERPALEVQIEGTYDPVKDTEALRRKKFQENLRAQRWAKLSKSKQQQVAAKDLPVTDQDYRSEIEKAWRKLMKASGTNAVAGLSETNSTGQAQTTSTAVESDRGATILLLKSTPKPKTKLTFADKERHVLETIAVPDEELKKLADERAKEVKEKLIATGKVESARLSLAESVASSNGTTRVNFRLE